MIGAVRQLRNLLGGERRLAPALMLSVLATGVLVIVPYVLAKMTNAIFAGVIGGLLPAGLSREQAIARLREQGRGALADVVDASGASPGQSFDWAEFWWLTSLAAGLYLIATAARSGSGVLLNQLVQDSIRRLRTRIEAKLHRLPVSALEGRRRGEVLTTVTIDVDNLATAIGPVFVQLPVIALTVLAVAVALLVVSPLFAAVVLAGVPVAAAVVLLITRRARAHIKQQWATTAALTGHAEDRYSAHDVISAYDARATSEEEFEQLNGRLEHASRTGQSWSGAIAPSLTLCNALIFVAIAVLGALQMLEGAITLGALQAVAIYAQQLATPLAELAGTVSRIQSGLISLGRVRAFLALPQERSPAADDDPAPPEGRHARPPEIMFDDVWFGYEPDRPVLRGVSLHIPSGGTTAIVGTTGSGKTTMTALLQRFYEPDSGRILVDGKDISSLTRTQVRNQLAVVTQDPWLWTGTAGDNIAFGATAHPDSTAAGTVGAITAMLPNGAGTVVSTDAEAISAGEKQLITVARALAVRPRILIMDEATSAADPRTELFIQRGLSALRASTTTIVVTHRLSTLAAADEVVVLHDGRIAERGKPAELMNTGGLFAQFFMASPKTIQT